MDRMQILFGHLSTRGECSVPAFTDVAGKRFADTPDDVVIVSALRTPIGKAGRGSFKDTFPDELLAAVLSGILKDAKISHQQVGDICVGCVGDPRVALTARTGEFFSGFPAEVPIHTVNRQLESMSKYRTERATGDINPKIFEHEAAKATETGLFKDEIVPVTTKITDKDGNEREITVSDGAAAVLVAKRSEAEKLGLPILGVIRSYAVVGVPPEIMGIGPAVAIPEALKKAAFASQAFYSMQKLGIPLEKVNPKGGAIALGHPLGCTGARQISTLLHELKRRGPRID
ncbi:hypothetical protein KUTeg_008564 [Tegillarca granosa]|uniref:acetyl-CoA C-acetyltransferase n=1 Tax=Tegillarca granosa TaxID=220873 RepID=A0ABQ9F9H5_TEGGR|nr:hypothetical protein KUTeg_008564 [Tegillarca granosa]